MDTQAYGADFLSASLEAIESPFCILTILLQVQRIPHSSLEETLILLQDTLAKSEDKGGPPVGVIVGVH